VTRGPLDLLTHLAAIFDEMGIDYVVGGSIASSLLAEPRTTNDVDLAVSIDADVGARLLERVADDFYVPFDAAHEAIRARTSFNLLDLSSALKADIFVLGTGLLDRRQLERRISISMPGDSGAIWVTAPEDQVLRKLDWFLRGGETSDRQWSDVLGILRVNAATLDGDDLRSAADEIGLADLLDRAIHEAGADLDG
jgi:hypothetical protein